MVGWDAGAARRRAQSSGSGPLAGWAIGVKDILDLDGTPTACGVEFLPPAPKTASARIVDQLQEQGAYALAKTVTTCFAYLDPGPTRNPWNPQHTPGGSSMGSAAAVATGMVRAAIGTQTVGSVCRPASFCGVVGFKPSYGAISTEGCFALVPTFDTIGFFTRTVQDMTTLWHAVARRAAPAEEPTGPLVVGIVEDLRCKPFDAEMIGALRFARDRLHACGIATREVTLPAELAAVYDNNRVIFEVEAARAHAELWARHRDAYPPKLKAVLESAAGGDSGERYAAACAARADAQERFAALFGEHRRGAGAGGAGGGAARPDRHRRSARQPAVHPRADAGGVAAGTARPRTGCRSACSARRRRDRIPWCWRRPARSRTRSASTRRRRNRGREIRGHERCD